ncbi:MULTISPECIES: MurR/RpiR family transcriptional regulator [Aminobacter]|jgi:DNA-binding MurR/RpiR family transcriptional regulator|uniref:DNA-binding MurR/RpiR family transcriptional regulator n=2 Tax=Aminobacter TaxID=31988 RepID=A0AAC8YSX7_AMIAI|nr:MULTISPECIES: MurR/RpiR family transcriptional regulator [Aminobacter]AMS43706.1 SIS domain-containing protein [Aminobacter aminovorans]MBA8908720.1 DNA-binding MurR/RpiR family transcriptional regulator [Aminobacter ciceronei]MBA9022559.1 DNA-binding MurR/RpiR family transcriptional regulator [Aminobacter ciceronei]MBB3707468.1 DNA-binding MurR/RpiR family transcriptional regulator [Aminobacter aminovorans]WMC98482.1 MurR/RpiR family transcriptional regulator [Aminobacter aminovorans]
MSVLTKIIATLDTMAPADRQIGQFIVDNPDEMLRLSSVALGEQTGRSQSSVVKFAQKLGYPSYQQLKLAVSEAKAQQWQAPPGMVHGSIDRADGYIAVQQKLVAGKLAAMQQTMSVNSEQTVERVLDLLDRAERIHLAGVSASSLVARDFAIKLMKLGRNVLHDSDSHVQLASAASLGARDVMLAFSHSGTSIETVRIAELAKERGATVIVISSLRDNPLSAISDVVLHSVSDEDNVRSSSITARDAQLALTDLLFILLVQRQDDANDHIHRSEAAVAALKMR